MRVLRGNAEGAPGVPLQNPDVPAAGAGEPAPDRAPDPRGERPGPGLSFEPAPACGGREKPGGVRM